MHQPEDWIRYLMVQLDEHNTLDVPSVLPSIVITAPPHTLYDCATRKDGQYNNVLSVTLIQLDSTATPQVATKARSRPLQKLTTPSTFSADQH